jgi:transcriptional regulator GlxA family with amidase domain
MRIAGGASMRKRRGWRYRKVVAQFDQVTRGNLEKFSRISDVRRAMGIDKRTMARAFEAIYGTTPVRYLHGLRLREVKQALSSTRPVVATVREVAIRFGFRELGRFAGEYRVAFGERPSETLERSRFRANRPMNASTKR